METPLEYWDNLGYVGRVTFKNPTIVNMNCVILEKSLFPTRVSSTCFTEAADIV